MAGLTARRSIAAHVLAAVVAAAPIAPAPLATATAAWSDLTHGVASGEVTATSAIVWGRCGAAGTLHVAVESYPVALGRATADRDFTARTIVRGLTPATAYTYRAWCEAEGGGTPAAHVSGSFRTAPAADDPAPVRFAWGGDLAGQNVCRDRTRGFPILAVVAALRPDFFIGLGDMIYADDSCSGAGRYGNAQVPGIGPATTLPEYWADWRYNRDDAGLRRVLARTSYYGVWDDHEVVDDFGPRNDTRSAAPWTPGRHLMPLGLAAFLDYAPMMPTPPGRLYRSARWGRHLELFFLDTRQYRDPNAAGDSAEHPKTMLGVEQRAWLEDALARSGATWQVIVSSVPLSVPTGGAARDGWADLGTPTGFERELLSLMRTIQRRDLRNVLWITTDVHFAAVFRDRPFPDDPGFILHEIAVGPLNAGVSSPRQVDDTLRPEVLFAHGPALPESVSSFDEALGWFNVGVIDIAADGSLQADIVDARGTRLYRLTLTPHAEPPGP